VDEARERSAPPKGAVASERADGDSLFFFVARSPRS
jgi:hypothetical protein